MRRTLPFFVFLAAFSCSACARIEVQKNPDDCCKGIRYYRPKPYLFVGPPPATGELGKVVVQIQYLPDYSEEYAVVVHPGLGTTDLDITLENGWNLTSLKGKTDQKYSEIIGALASMTSAAAGAVKDGPPRAAPCAAPVDVPLGYYEPVFANDHRNCKYLFGWRYVGLLPFNACPVQACPSVHDAYCDDPDQIWALTYSSNTLQLQRLRDVQTGVKTRIDSSKAPALPAAISVDNESISVEPKP